MQLSICHLYPDLLDLYGDRGNIIALAARCRWRGIEPAVVNASLGDRLDFNRMDILFIGGGSDREQGLLAEDLVRRKDDLHQAVEDGLVVLTICGGYQLMGRYYQTADGRKIPGLDLLNIWTEAGHKRLIGNVTAEINSEVMADGELGSIVGFENHSGKTYLGQGMRPLGRVVYGNGNNGEDGWEGVRFRNVFGTYLHGPLLPKNPHLADTLLQLAFERRGYVGKLPRLNDDLEILAHQAVLKRWNK